MNNLTQAQIAELATKYGFDANDKMVQENAAQADKHHGTPNSLFDGDLKRFWGCDATGCYNAYNLLDGYLSEEARIIGCDAKASADFEREYR